MKYVPKEVDHSVNRPKEHPLADLAWLVGGSLVGVALLIFVVMQISEVVAKRISMKQEIELVDSQFGFDHSPKVVVAKFPQATPKLQSLVDQLWEPYSPEQNLKLKAEIKAAPFENAFMGLGGNMTLTSKLLKNSGSENEVSFVICHEIGHFFHRDVIRGLSTRVMLMAALSLLGLSGNDLGFIDAGVNSSLLSFSRHQETRADEFAVGCTGKRYGHLEGFDAFFLRAMKENPEILNSKYFEYMSTHPMGEGRIDRLRSYAESKGISTSGPLQKQSIWSDSPTESSP